MKTISQALLVVALFMNVAIIAVFLGVQFQWFTDEVWEYVGLITLFSTPIIDIIAISIALARSDKE